MANITPITPNNNQQVMTLSWLANAAGINKWTQTDLQNAIDGISGTYWSPGYDWNVVWGPAYYEPKDSSKIGNTMFVAQQGTWYVIAIAGTNPHSTFDWVQEDGDIAPTPWTYYTVAGNVTTGDNLGLTNLLTLTSPNTLQAFLASLSDKETIQLTITGHSLGGALSPLLTMALMDPNSSASSGINLSYWKQVTLLATAGPTPGDATFAAYVQNFVTNNPSQLTADFIWNSNDIVPHAWSLTPPKVKTETNTLQELPAIYPDVALPGDSCVSAAITSAINNATPYTYTQFDSIPGFTGQLQPYGGTELSKLLWGESSKYLAQADYQHTQAYIDNFACSSWFPPNDICNKPDKAERLYAEFCVIYKAHGGTGCV
ncbi:MAG: hypothetical protein WAW41_02335 [Methylobacter sp.]